MEIKGIDVSSWQGKPDWAKVSNSGIKFAILRIHQKSGTDASFEHNYKGWLVVEAEQDPAKAHPLTYATMGYRNLKSLAEQAGLTVTERG